MTRFTKVLNRLVALQLLVIAFMGFTAATADAGHHMEKKAAKDIVATAVAADDFNTLAAALQAAGLVDTLRGDGPFTVFAPTDAAFAALPEGTVDMLLQPENRDQLIAVLTYHVVPGKVTAADVVKLKSATTINGDAIDIKVTEKGVNVDAAQVVMTDIGASNGIIHVIDSVIMPDQNL